MNVTWEQLGEHAEKALEQAKLIRSVLPPDDPIMPVFMAYLEDDLALIGMPWSSKKEQDECTTAIKEFHRKRGPILAYVCVMEGWVTKVERKLTINDLTGKSKILPPSQDPNRGEGIFVEYAMPGKSGIIQCNFTSKSGKIEFGEICKSNMVNSRARFYELWGAIN